jgi:hypothetical protein
LSLTLSVKASDAALATSRKDEAAGASGSNSTSPLKSRIAKVGLCPIAESAPPAKARAVKRLPCGSTR